MLARKYNVTSNFGKIIDPVADKMLIISTLPVPLPEGMVAGSQTAFDCLVLWVKIQITEQKLPTASRF